MLAKHYRKKGFVVACQDEATFGLLPHVVRGWAKRGSRPIIRQNPQHKKIDVIGARTKRTFVFSFCQSKNQRTFVVFLKKLSQRWSKVCLFTDSAPYHKGKQIEQFLASHPKTFRIIYFLKYSPELNPVEPCWQPARKTTGNRLIPSINSMKYHLRKVFSKHSLLPKMFKYLSD